MGRVIALALWLALSAVADRARCDPIAFGGPTMGTTYHVRLAAAPKSTDAAQLKLEIESLLADIDRQMSTYRPDSELSGFNRAQADSWYPVSSATAEVVAAALAIGEKTGGALDVTVGPLVRLWHFGPRDTTNKSARQAFEPPSEQLLAAAREAVGLHRLAVRIDPPALKKNVDALEIDLSSIAPGYTVDRMAELLHRHEIDDFMVEIGGEVRAAGLRADGRPWRVAIERPLTDRREMQMALPLSNAAISTAGGYRKFFEHGGRRYSHIIDPATGRPVEHALSSVTVVAETCLAADGWDTPLLVLGPTRGYQCAVEHNVAAMFISHDLAGEREEPQRIETTPAWKARFAGENHAALTPPP